jgi:hypothetical protein
MGCYPVFCCQNWTRLSWDLEAIQSDFVSLVLVTDPFCPLSVADLQSLFDRVVPFKIHYLANVRRPIREFVSGSRYRSGRSALRRLSVEVTHDAEPLLDDWMALQAELSKRHRVTGMNKLSCDSVRRLFRVPGLIVFRAVREGITAGMHIDFVKERVVYAHLAAYSSLGYEIGVSTAMNIYELEYFQQKADWIDWGGVSGVVDDPSDSLGVFKKRFSSDRLPVYLCMKIFNQKQYDDLSRQRGRTNAKYLPAYRSGEFV